MQSCLHKYKIIFTLILLLIFLSLGFGCGSQKEPPMGTLIIEGDAVEHKVLLTLDELKSMEKEQLELDYFCLNSYGSREYFHFKGIWIWHILQDKVNLKENATKAVFIGEDGYKAEYPIADIKKTDYIDEQNPKVKHRMILAWEEDGMEYDPQRGNPFRLVVGQKWPGDVNKPYWVYNVRTIHID